MATRVYQFPRVLASPRGIRYSQPPSTPLCKKGRVRFIITGHLAALAVARLIRKGVVGTQSSHWRKITRGRSINSCSLTCLFFIRGENDCRSSNWNTFWRREVESTRGLLLAPLLHRGRWFCCFFRHRFVRNISLGQLANIDILLYNTDIVDVVA